MLDFVSVIIIPIVSFLTGVIYWSIKTTRSDKSLVLGDQIRIIKSLREKAIRYWTAVDDQSDILEVKLRADFHELAASHEDVMEIFGLQATRNNYTPAYIRAIKAVTGGEFEQSNRTADRERAIQSVETTVALERVIRSKKRDIEGVNPVKWLPTRR